MFKFITPLLLCMVFLGTGILAVFAEPVSVIGRQQGQAFTFSHRGQCFAILPNHVSKRNRFNLRSSTPAREGSAKMTPLRFPESDFALATVSGPLAETCQPLWSQLPKDLGRQLPLGGLASLIHIRRSGVKESIAVRMSPISYEHIGISPQKANRGTIGQGKSGSLLVVNNIPVGIAIDLPEKSSAYGAAARVLRMDAMVARLSRYIEGRSSLPETTGRLVNKTQSAGENITYQVKGWNVTPLDADHGPENIAANHDNPFITPPLTKQVKLELALSGNSARIIREIEVVSDLSNDKYTSPKSVGVFASSRTNKNRFRTISTREMSPEGKLLIRFAPTKARWLLLKIRSVWAPTKPLRIDHVIVR